METTPAKGAPALFEPVRLGAVTLPNRVAMAPMSRSRAAADGTPGPLMATYYAQRASAGLIIAEGTHPGPAGRIGPGAPGLHTDEHQRGWARVADAVHGAGGHVFVQLMHAGRLAHPGFLPGGLRPVAPSPVRARTLVYTPDGRLDAVTPRELSAAQIRQIVGDFARAARRAVAAGLDGVEIHAANGYLLHQFLGDGSNLRADAWGGGTAGRIRIVVEVVRAVAAAVGPERVGLRISPGNRYGDMSEHDPAGTYTALIGELAGDPIAYLHLSETGDAELDGRIHALWPTALIVTPLNNPADLAKTHPAAWWLKRGADMVAFGSAFVANPDLVERLRTGAPLNHPLPTGLYGGGAEGYTDYPTLDRRRGDGG
ncbi:MULTISPECIES: alkene reductase [Streptosporangium]|uniref:N-ethylmaleimide reductase n=1 Tax=Streptosporangium brasiliense TaxID=47480 RepID=A0ABT9RE44_9ACTN|nr:alkene reductase [Streptosporangium brasiliense]MDP9867543.1 N-ethylmaleimide reductase [Streptosporangium brasiliense]